MMKIIYTETVVRTVIIEDDDIPNDLSNHAARTLVFEAVSNTGWNSESVVDTELHMELEEEQ